MARRSFWMALVVFCFCINLCNYTAAGQAVYGSILGTVTDPQGAAVAGAKVTITNIGQGTSQETTTNEDGNYSVTHLIPGAYKVKVEATGFQGYEVSSVQVSADTGVKVDATMTVGSVTQSIEVTSEVPQLKTDRADVSITFNEKYVTELPILNRNFTSFELLSPGTQKLVGWSHAATKIRRAASRFCERRTLQRNSVRTRRDRQPGSDFIGMLSQSEPGRHSRVEDRVANYDAEFGKAVAGVVTVQTKSGTNQFHGSGFFDFRGDGQEARNPFKNAPDKPLPNASFKQFGGRWAGRS